MDLWIRSQSRSMLIKATDVHLDYDTMIKCDKHIVADYSTTERALEVLDEIQTLLLGDVLLFKNFNVNSEDLSEIGNQLKTKVLGMVDVNNKDTDIKFIPRDCIVYEMPKE